MAHAAPIRFADSFPLPLPRDLEHISSTRASPSRVSVENNGSAQYSKNHCVTALPTCRSHLPGAFLALSKPVWHGRRGRGREGASPSPAGGSPLSLRPPPLLSALVPSLRPEPLPYARRPLLRDPFHDNNTSSGSFLSLPRQSLLPRLSTHGKSPVGVCSCNGRGCGSLSDYSRLYSVLIEGKHTPLSQVNYILSESFVFSEHRMDPVGRHFSQVGGREGHGAWGLLGTSGELWGPHAPS